MLFIWWYKHSANALSESHERKDEVWETHSAPQATGAFGPLDSGGRNCVLQICQRRKIRSWIKRAIIKSKLENNLSIAKGKGTSFLLLQTS